MLLLASILGPGKPPVATEEELASAPAAYKVRGRLGALVAERPGAAVIQIPPGDRCLVCLCDYELEEEIRQLTQCGHLYHRTCIDEVRLPVAAPCHPRTMLTGPTVAYHRTKLMSALSRARCRREARVGQGLFRAISRAIHQHRRCRLLNLRCIFAVHLSSINRHLSVLGQPPRPCHISWTF